MEAGQSSGAALAEPAHATTVTYEELCTDSDGVLRRLYAFVGVEPANAGRAWRGQEHHVLGNGMRFDTGADVRLDDRWKATLGAGALATFDSEAGALNRRFGYC